MRAPERLQPEPLPPRQDPDGFQPGVPIPLAFRVEQLRPLAALLGPERLTSMVPAALAHAEFSLLLRGCSSIGRMAPQDWRDRRVLLLTDVRQAAVGDRVLYSLLAHALCAAGARLTVYYGCPERLQHHRAQVHQRQILDRLYPCPAVTDLSDLERALDFDLYVWPAMWPMSAPIVPRGINNFFVYAEKILGLDLRIQYPRPPPRESLPPRYIALQTGATSHPYAIPLARDLAIRRARETALPLVAIGLYEPDQPIPEEAIDTRGVELPALMDIIGGATEGFGADSGPAHIAGVYGVPWTAIRETRTFRHPWWWLAGYPSVTRLARHKISANEIG